MQKETNPILNIFLWIIRIAVGGLFIFSGLVKANDPKGLAYKMGEFFEAWAIKDNFLPDFMHWLNEFALPFAIIMIVLEIVAGLALILGYRFKFFSWLIFLLTAFFTFLTAYVLFSGNIKACGCFGDCIPLTPNETFTKDIILLILITILLLFRSKIKALVHIRIANLIMLIGLALAIYMNLDVLKNLPYNDCLPYKVGNNIAKEMERPENYKDAVIENKLIYKNLKTGEEKGFTNLDKAPWHDTLNWEYVENIQTELSPAQNEPKILDFGIASPDGENVTDDILGYSQNVLLLFVRDVSSAKMNKVAALHKVIAKAKETNTPILAASPSPTDEVEKFKATYELDIDFYLIDGVVCKTAMRTNPGIMMLNKGTVLGKWSYNNFDKVLPQLTTQQNIPMIPIPDPETTSVDSVLNNE